MGVFAAIVLVLAVVVTSLKRVPGHERMVVFRLGRLARISGPGTVFLIPVVDRGKRVNLSEAVPGWQALSREDLDRKVIAFALGPDAQESGPRPQG